MATTGFCSTVQIPSLVNDKVPGGVSPVLALKAMQHGFAPHAGRLRCQLEDSATESAVTILATVYCRTVQVSGSIKDQTSCGVSPVLALKGMQHGPPPPATRVM